MDKINSFVNSAASFNILDLEDLKDNCKSNSICPYFYNKKVSTKADIIFMPYNYIFSKQDVLDLKNSILVIDEAHNFTSVCEDSMQFTLGKENLDEAWTQLRRLDLESN